MVKARWSLYTDAWADQDGPTVPKQRVSKQHRSGSRKLGALGLVTKLL